MINLNDLMNLTTTEKIMLYDNSCKQILSQKQVLARIVSSLVKESAHLTLHQIEDIIGDVKVSNYPVKPHYKLGELNNESNILGEGILYYDIRFLLDIVDDDIEVRLYFDIEAQNEANPGYPIVSRGIVYSSRMISQQYGEEYDSHHYGKLKKVYSIWIMPQAAKYMDGVINTYGIEERRIQGNYYEEVENYDKICIILIYLSSKHELHDKYENYDNILTPLALLLTNRVTDVERKKRILHEQYGFEFTEGIEKEMNSMCNLGEGLVIQTAMRVEAEVTERVTKEVTKEVTKRITIKYLERLIASGMTLIQALDILEIPEENRKSLIENFSI